MDPHCKNQLANKQKHKANYKDSKNLDTKPQTVLKTFFRTGKQEGYKEELERRGKP